MKKALLILVNLIIGYAFCFGQTLDKNKVYSRFPTQEYGGKKNTSTPETKPIVPISNNTEIKSEEGKKIPNTEEIKKTPKTVEIKKTPKTEKIKEVPTSVKTKTNTNPESKSGLWTLEQCIQYALQKNLQVNEADLNRRMTELTLDQSKASRYPNVNGDVSLGNSYGRGIDPTSNQFVNQRFLFNNAGLNSQVLLFGWFQKKYEIQQNSLNAQIAEENYKQLKDDIALNIATGYLRVLLAREQINIAKEQLKTDVAQLNQTIQFVNAGKLPELNVAQMRAQVASDSSTYITAATEEQLALLQLKALMNFSFDKEFDIASPAINAEETYRDYNLPDANGVFDIAVRNLHRMKSRYLSLLASRKGLDLARAAKYPSIFLGGNIGTSYSSNFQQITGQTYIGETPVGFVTVGGTQYPLTTPNYDFSRQTIPYQEQLNNNIRSNIALTMSIPILNGLMAKTNVERAKIGLVSQQIALETEQLNLRQDVYRAHLESQAALQKYKAAESQKASAKRALDFAIQRYNIGMLSTFEYAQTQNNFNQASSSALASKYEMLFKLKVLDYYMGNSIKL